ncbi:type I-E CRISPR-associated protein Cse2/CasB [Nonomuraea sp. NPDC050663]|uniref:type I-E CRISPR-associated protein Cse2/CasB n=1 Tax=Nonomuraea sp. NPDC050663 TaxID=3364370 RepID=UPI0037BCDDC7
MTATAERYVTHLAEVFGRDPGRRAAARRSLGRPVNDPMTRRADAVVARWLPENRSTATEAAYYTVAALIATQPKGSEEGSPGPGNLGHTLGLAVRDKGLNPDGIEKRLHLLCRQDVRGVHRQLPALIRQLTGAGLQPDWAGLLLDLGGWDRRRDQITKRWLQAFYRAANPVNDVQESENQ